MAVARWMYDACIPINAVNSSNYQPMLNVVASYDPGYRGPNYHALRNAINLSNLFDEIVNWVGPTNIVHLVTDNTANYVAAGRILCGKYKNISWSPCAAHCLNLIFKETEKMDHVAKLAKRVSKITVFIYNHVALQAWLRTRKNWIEIVRPGPTRFATTVIALGSLKEHKHDLQALVTSKFYVESRYAKDKKAKAAVKIILDNQFWNDCHVIVHIVSPLIRLLCIVNSDEKPAMGYIYDGMYRAIDEVKKNFKDKKRLWESYVNIIKDRWDTQFYRDIHAASYWLNPAFQYASSTLNKRLETQSAVTDVIELKVYVGRMKVKRKKFNFDSIDYASIDKTEFWIVEDEEPPFLDHKEIENALYEEGAYPIEEWSSSHIRRDDAPPGFRNKNHHIPIEDEEGENEDEDDDNDASGGAFDSHDDIDFNFLHNK
ncbi:uncharacterized protein LOC142608902 [Castanea sativa]|uniref:uncharacterized protein LOC142608902 n=1 Tax=Castanea sativa TaxID=21020 RepID=UPI003F64D308